MNLNTTLLLLIPLLPLAGFVLLGLWGRRVFKSHSGWIGTLLMAASCCIAIYTAYTFFSHPNAEGGYLPVLALNIPWLKFNETLSINLGILLDPISVMMIVVVTLVSLMVHIYSLGYMKGEARYATYYSFLSLFTFSMLGLVIASNLFQIYIFWELVGVSSFLLIGFYFDKPSAVAAAKKAFIVTRFADLGFLIGILIISYCAGSLDFITIIGNFTNPSGQLAAATSYSFLGISAITWGMGLIFIGGAGKSAMFPLHIWLPDAMEGPTPVSALIHAATMVVAGVFLVARLFPVYTLNSPGVLNIIGWVGAISAAFAAVIACTQTDIKRVLAYSTMSQIGYMMFALGVTAHAENINGGFTASMFHLFTHAMFKALLFLGAGAVIHYVHSNEMDDMGGLRKKMPVTHITFLVACLAIAGVWPFAGFFSKEAILHAAHEGNIAIYWIALLTSGLTAFYMFRLYFKIFWNKPFVSHSHDAHHGEGPLAMLFPLFVLAIGALGSGWIPFNNYVTADHLPHHAETDWGFAALPLALGATGILVAAWFYLKANRKPDQVAAGLNGFYKAAYRKFYIDEIYQFVTKKIIFNLIGRPAAWFDKNVVDGMINVTGNATQALSAGIKKLQSGRVQQYALYFLGGAIVLAVLFIYILK